jgi:hypothetical protein
VAVRVTPRADRSPAYQRSVEGETTTNFVFLWFASTRCWAFESNEDTDRAMIDGLTVPCAIGSSHVAAARSSSARCARARSSFLSAYLVSIASVIVTPE